MAISKVTDLPTLRGKGPLKNADGVEIATVEYTIKRQQEWHRADTHDGQSEVKGFQRTRGSHLTLKAGSPDFSLGNEFTLVLEDGSTALISVEPTLMPSVAGEHYDFSFRGDIQGP